MNETVSLETREVRFLSVFDFDGTLTYRDSFVPFLRFAFGNRVFFRRMLRMAGPSLAYLCRRIGRDDLKARLIATFLTDVPVHVLEERALAYQNRFWETLMRPHALTAVADQVSSGSTVTICSASPSLLLRPFAEKLGVHLIATELEVVDGVLTGRIVGRNCRRDEKVCRLERHYGPLTQYSLRAWGDSRGDTELLAAALERFWKPFR
ncbi:TPA: HAD-IB family phosphatase [Pseudomonas aeruginosa]|uniref:HAD-IB family phosphatase n=1 Tax=Pseudomonas aeruginosa TaxID=287 RepID=UPI00044AC86F|nr:HAD-IB family phosphatase [Pseudomonas aeruginosa]ETV16602.1 HAD hydrolase, family IB [Pseudomonas aeruginosa BWHPSA043]KHE33298.1 HAD family hydrolase [Pseudomonas aeruginosa]RUI16880.1 HAD-IB family hydrolase [Pseudomonas aeruginosa]HBO6116821.1 HAD-IB family phosphatase [Pseudomonas aeruginosa]HBP1116726.1 HAD-IB family phosphatase [Pseudomonas aeruginosa]